MQDLGSAFRGLVIAKSPFNRSSESEDTNTYLLELVRLQSPIEVLRTAATFLNRGPMGRPLDSRGSDTWGGEGHAYAKGPFSCEPPGSSPLVVQ